MLPAWGKTDKDSGEVHPLAHHSMDVAAVFARMLQLPVIRDRLEAAAGTPLTESTCRRLAALARLRLLHGAQVLKVHRGGGWSRSWYWRGIPSTTSHLLPLTSPSTWNGSLSRCGMIPTDFRRRLRRDC